MIYAWKITDRSQTTCILRSIHARLLQLLRDITSRGHGPTLSIVPSSPLLVLLIPVWSSQGAEMVWSLEIRPHRNCPLRLPAAFHPSSPRLSHLSAHPPGRNLSCEIFHRALSHSQTGLACSRIRQLHWQRRARKGRTERLCKWWESYLWGARAHISLSLKLIYEWKIIRQMDQWISSLLYQYGRDTLHGKTLMRPQAAVGGNIKCSNWYCKLWVI